MSQQPETQSADEGIARGETAEVHVRSSSRVRVHGSRWRSRQRSGRHGTRHTESSMSAAVRAIRSSAPAQLKAEA